MAHKSRKESKNAIFQLFRGVKMHIFARNRRNRSKLSEQTPGPTQIDPRGHDAIRIFDICSYCVEYRSKIEVFFVERRLGHI